MSHPIIEGSVKLLKVVTPGAYWIRCKACEGSSRVPTSIKQKPHPNEYYYPQQGAKVFAQDEDGFFYRGSICGRRVLPKSDYWKYVVQLTDTFQVKDFDQDHVYPSYGESSAACESAHLVSLYHLLPQIPPIGYGKLVKMDNVECKAFENAVVNWGRSVVSMAQLTEGNVNFFFEQCKLIGGSIYGNLSMSLPLLTQSGTVCRDLSEYLHYEKLAVRMTYRFEHVVKALMTNPMIDFTELLDTFDPFGKATFKPKPVPPLEKPPEPIEPDFSGFKVHPHDLALHQSLTQEFHINILYTGAPPKHDTIVRYENPDGYVLLGTVLNVHIKYAEELDSPLSGFTGNQLFHVKQSSLSISKTTDECPEIYYPDKLFENLPPEPDTPGSYLLSYDFDESRRNFHAAGGVFKERLLPYPYSSAVEKRVVQHFNSLGVESLYEWQKLCLPTFLCRKNLLVIGSKSTGKLTTSIISALSWMSYVNKSKSYSVHPQLIIFFCDFERAEKTASFCVQQTDFTVIQSTSSFVSEKQKVMAMNGCDVLITTPSNWAELVSQNVFDYSRLNHVIFDEFDRLHKMYAEELVNILDVLGASRSRRVQTVIVSNSWGALISDKRVQDKVEFPTVCIMGVILACCYYKLTPTAVFIEHNDWMKHLENIMSMTCEQKRLLLCKDEKEGRSIIEKMPHSGHVRFAHGNLHKETAWKILKEWDRCCDKLLVCTDDCFENLDFMKDVDVMISWMTSSWNTLSSRFMAFSHSLGSQRVLSRASAYLFCDCEKLEELFLIKNISYNVRFINGPLDERLSRASMQAEHGKLTNICPFVFMFGKCDDFLTCPLRHVFLPDDDPEVLDVRQFLTVDLLKVHCAFRYSVRVREIVSNSDPKASTKTYALISKLVEIENGLMKACRKPCSPSTLIIGRMVGACIVREGDSLLRRVTVESVPENGSPDLYSVSIVDFEEPDVCLPLSQLFVLPEDVAKYPKDVVDLYITELMPADFKSDWQNDTYSYVTSIILNQIKESTFLAGKMEMIIANRTVLVDSLHCFRCGGPFQKTMVSISSSEFHSLKDLILVSGYCVKNVAHLTSLSELLVKCTTSHNCLHLDPEGRYGCRTDLPTYPVRAIVSSYDDPGLMYVQLSDESEKLANFESELSSTLERSKQKLHLIALDELCAVQYQGAWNRAIIFDITGYLENPVGSIHILFVDHGDSLLDAQPHELYCLPEELANVPFFAIQCELLGIKPFGNGEWHEKAVEEFGSYIRTSDDKMETLTVEFHGTKNTERSSRYYWRYLVVLSAPHDPDVSINFHLARRGLARLDPETKHVLKKPLINGGSEKYSTNFRKRQANH